MPLAALILRRVSCVALHDKPFEKLIELGVLLLDKVDQVLVTLSESLLLLLDLSHGLFVSVQHNVLDHFKIPRELLLEHCLFHVELLLKLLHQSLDSPRLRLLLLPHVRHSLLSAQNFAESSLAFLCFFRVQLPYRRLHLLDRLLEGGYLIDQLLLNVLSLLLDCFRDLCLDCVLNALCQGCHLLL